MKYKQNCIWSGGAFNYFNTSDCYLSARDGQDIDNYVLNLICRSQVIFNNKIKICNYNKKKLLFFWQACTNEPTYIFHKTLNQISVRVQLQTMHYSRHFTRFPYVYIYFYVYFIYLSSECAVVMLSELFASVSCSSLISSLMAAEDGSSSSVSDSHFCKRSKHKNDKRFKNMINI